MASGRNRYSVISDGLPSQIPDVDPSETQEWLDSLDGVIDSAGARRARFLMLKLLERAREKQVGVPALRSTDYVNTIPAEDEPWFPGDEFIERRIRAYIRWNAAIMVSRANTLTNVGGHIATYASQREPLRGRLQPLLPRQGGRRVRRPGLHPGPRLPRHLRPRLPRRPADRGAARRLPAGDQPRRPAVVPAPAADAGLLGVPDRLDGPLADAGDLPGAVQPLPARPPDQGHLAQPRVGLLRRRRDGRGRVARRARRRGARGARQPDVRRQLQPAAPRRPGARQRQDHPGARVLLPRRRLARHQGGVGPRVGRAARPRRRRRPRQRDEHHARTGSSRSTRSATARSSATTSSAATRGCARWSSTSPTRRSPGSRAAGTTTARSTPRSRRRATTSVSRR